MAKNIPKALLDTNILISAHIFGGKPEETYNLILEKRIIPVISPTLIGELTETLIKKFNFELKRIKQFERIIRKHFIIVYPNQTLNILNDKDDNRVLEAAIEGRCNYIVTGDKELLELKKYKNIKIVNAKDFLDIFYEK
ncbi:MAG: putative toxin-antitoxin system toxin component, PIN family [Candidatus Levybacteria bacterium]|nr:putative toxin-antitoxin system toxin component, PIN family [Candidatus Levybacteria bacterium]